MRTVLSLSFFGDGGVTSGTLSPLTSVTGRTLTLFDSLNYNEFTKAVKDESFVDKISSVKLLKLFCT